MLTAVKIPRWMTGGPSSRDSWSLHTFCDASKCAYAAAVYLRCTTSQGVSVQLLQAKTRVAPLKMSTIPRLELLACTIGSRLTAMVRKALSMEHIPSTYWSDSTTAITWIQRDSNWGVFVANQVREILQMTKVYEWRHIPGADNPADLPSRGCSPQQLLRSRWWEGPVWLHQEQSAWPTTDLRVEEDILASEMKRSTVMTLQVQPHTPWYMRRFSEYFQILRLVAWVNR